VVGNDSIQTLGTFLSSNEKKHWTTLWLFAGSILAATLIYGWWNYSGDVSYDRLAKYPEMTNMSWVYLLPSGYLLAFGLAVVLYYFISNIFEKQIRSSELDEKQRAKWTFAQWCSTGFLWAMWLIQDFANIYVYLPRALSGLELIVSLCILLAMLGYIFYQKGGNIQKIVKAKTNTTDIRSATIIDLLFGLILLFFKELNNVPMSTTWVFIGLLAGRELAIKFKFEELEKDTFKDVGMDLIKVFFGLAVSIALVYCIKLI